MQILIPTSCTVLYRISRINIWTCPVFLKHLEGRFPTAYIEICGCVTTGIPFVIVMRKSDIEAALVLIRKLVTWLVLLFTSVKLYLPEPCMVLVLSGVG